MLSWRSSTVYQPLLRSSRKSEWLRCALAHHYSPDAGVENEVVVLATGIDQYLQEVFHHLAFYNCDDVVSQEDFRLLCLVLGIYNTHESNTDKCDAGEDRGICSELPKELNFKEFHERLCGVFSLKTEDGRVRLLVSEETEHIEREVRLRWPRVRRRKCVSFDLTRDHARRRPVRKPGRFPKQDAQLVCTMDSSKPADASPQSARQEQLEAENASLRELVEDLRSALQSSDARCMALEVALHRERGTLTHKPGLTSETWGCATGREEGKTRHPKCAEWERRRGTADLLRELELIRASRDGQLQEAMRFNQRLEEELRAAYRENSRLEELVARLKRDNSQIKKRAEEARGALAAGLERVMAIQNEAQQIGPLQDRVRELESKLKELSKMCDNEVFLRPAITSRLRHESRADGSSAAYDPTLRTLPTGQDETFTGGEESLQRAVEGRAASDEEEEERGRDGAQCCLLEVKRLINRPHNCIKGYQSTDTHHSLISQSNLHGNNVCGFPGSREARGWGRGPPTHVEEKESEFKETLHLSQEKADMLELEVQMVETERRRLSLLEDKLADALTLLLQLRAKKVSRQALGKILMDTLDLHCSQGQAPSPVLEAVDALCKQLVCCELLAGRGASEVGGGTRGESPGESTSTNPPLLSC